MTLLWMDGFEGYTLPSTSAIVNNRWFNTFYQTLGANGDGSRHRIAINLVNGPEGNRVAARLTRSGSGTRGAVALHYSLAEHARYNDTLFVGMKLFDFTRSTPYLGNMAIMSGNYYLMVFTLGKNYIRVTYAEAGGRKSVDIPSFLSGGQDLLEFSFKKVSNTPGQMSNFSLFVNNRIMFSGNIFNNYGEPEALGIMPLGVIRPLPWGYEGQDFYALPVGTVGYWTSSLLMDGTGTGGVPAQYYDGDPFSITDFVVNNDKGTYNKTRLGKVRVLARYPEADAGPNEYVLPEGAASHTDIVGDPVPAEDRRLTTEAAAASEMFSSPNFFPLDSEGILASALKVTGAKQDATGFNFEAMYRIGVMEYAPKTINLTDTARMHLSIHELNPATNTPWTGASINGARFGVRTVT